MRARLTHRCLPRWPPSAGPTWPHPTISGCNFATRVCVQRLTPHPQDGCSDDPGSAEGVRELVIPSGQRTELLAASDQVLHQVTASVQLAIKRAAPTLVLLVGKGVENASAAAVGAGPTTGVGLVAHDPRRVDAWQIGTRAARPAMHE